MSERGGAKAWVLAFVAVAGLGLAALIGVGCAIGANTCPFGGREITTTDGRELWFQAGCAACHGVAGRGGTRAPSLVTGERAELPVEELERRIARGRPLAGMPAFRRSLSEEQIRAVAEYVVRLREGSS